MLESGNRIFDCEIIELLSENSIYRCYRVNCDLCGPAKMLVITDPAQTLAGGKTPEIIVQELSDCDDPGLGLPIRCGEENGLFVCLFPEPVGIRLADCGLQSGRQALELLRSLLQRLERPHRAGLSHGHINPMTILLDGGVARLDDFSLSDILKLDYQSGVDPAYISPEQVRGETATGASDIYSLGAVLSYLLTVQAPFRGSDAFSIAMQHLQDGFPGLPGGHPCGDLLEKMTRLSADRRPQCAELLADIDRLLNDATIDQLEVDSAEDQPVTAAAQDSAAAGPERTAESGISARIEARLKKSVRPPDADIDATRPQSPRVAPADAAHAGVSAESTRRWRWVPVLLLGILIGAGGFFFLDVSRDSGTEAPVVADSHPGQGFDRALQALRAEDFAGAALAFEQIVQDNDSDPHVLNNLAVSLAAQGDYEKAREYLELALKTDAGYETIYLNLSAIYAEMARTSYEKALQLEPGGRFLRLAALSDQGVVELETPAAQPASKEREALEDLVAGDPPPEGADLGSVVEPGGAAEIVSSQTQSSGEEGAGPQQEISQVSMSPDSSDTTAVAAADGSAGSTSRIDEEVDATRREQGMLTFLDSWSRAWSSQDVEAYLGFYDPAFVPPGGKTRDQWERQRRDRIARPRWIEVTLAEARAGTMNDGGVRVDVIQSYKSDVYEDRTRKQFDLRRHEGGWSIVRERSLGKAR